MSRRPSALTRLLVTLALALQVALPVLPASAPSVAVAAEAALAVEAAPLLRAPALALASTLTRPAPASAPADDSAVLPFVLLSLDVTPERATPGSEVTLAWQVSSRELTAPAGRRRPNLTFSDGASERLNYTDVPGAVQNRALAAR